MIIQRIAYPETATLEEDLYIRFNHSNVALFGEKREIISAHSFQRIDFNTYFNMFSIRKWKKYTSISNIKLSIDILGAARVVLTGYELHGQSIEEYILDSVVVDHKERKNVTIEYPHGVSSDAFSFCIYPLSEQVHLYEGAYISDIDEEKLNDIKLALAICTYHRETFVERNMRMLLDNVFCNPASLLHGRIKVYISDNGNTLRPDHFDNSSVVIIPNKNSGGAGGFSRSAIEAIEDNVYSATHIILMDDDIQFSVDALERTYIFLRLLKSEYLTGMIGGAMLRMDLRNIQHAAGETFTANGGILNKTNYDLYDLHYILRNEVEENINYLGWWYCCVSKAVFEKNGFALPIFFQLDDIEFGLRNTGIPKITLNGICCWHPPLFQWPGARIYYSVRNTAIVKALYFDEFSKIRFLLDVSKPAIKNLFLMSYQEANLALLGGEDFLKGLSWLRNQDPKALNDKIYSLVTQPVPVEKMPCSFDPRALKWNGDFYKVKRHAFLCWITLNGWLLPSRKVVTVELNNPPLRYLYRAKTVIKYDTNMKKGLVANRDYKEAARIICRLFRLSLSAGTRYNDVVDENLKIKNEVITKDFWKKYLGA